jgi:hypothetical protein
MKPAPLVLFGLCLVNFLTPPAGAQVVLIGGSTRNGNLDRTYAQEVSPGFFLPKPQVWFNTGTLVIAGPTENELSSEPWAGPLPTPLTSDGNLNPPPPDGCDGPDCGVFFKPFNGNLTDGALNAHLYQDLAAAPGASYLLTAWIGGDTNVLANGAELALEFLDAGHTLIPGSGHVVNLLPTLSVPNGALYNYKLYAAIADAPGGTFGVRARVSILLGLSNPGGGPQAFVVDDVILVGIDDIFADGFESGNRNAWSH